MPIRLLIACGMLAVACPVSAQVHGYGHGGPVYDSRVAPYYHSHDYAAHHGHSHPQTYSHGYRSSHAPLAYQYDARLSHDGFGYDDFEQGRGAPISNCYACPGNSVCPLENGYAHADAPQQYEQFGDQQYGGGQFRASPSHDGHVHDGTHAHNHADEGLDSSLEPRGDIWRQQPMPRNQVPFRDQAATSMQTLPPSDRQPVAPPTLPPSSLPRPSESPQFEAPLGNGPPPDTVPLSSPRRSLD